LSRPDRRARIIRKILFALIFADYKATRIVTVASRTWKLPVEQPTKFDLIIYLKAAKQIGLTIPQSMLYQADKVIK